MQTDPIVVGFDPGLKNAGWAEVRKDNTLGRCGLLWLPSVIDRRKVKGDLALELMIEQFRDLELGFDVDLLAIEGQQVGRQHPNPIDIVRIGWVGGMAAGRIRATKTIVVNPGDWTGGVRKEAGQNRALRRANITREEIQKRAKCTASRVSEIVSALGIGQWAWKKLARES